MLAKRLAARSVAKRLPETERKDNALGSSSVSAVAIEKTALPTNSRCKKITTSRDGRSSRSRFASGSIKIRDGGTCHRGNGVTESSSSSSRSRFVAADVPLRSRVRHASQTLTFTSWCLTWLSSAPSALRPALFRGLYCAVYFSRCLPRFFALPSAFFYPFSQRLRLLGLSVRLLLTSFRPLDPLSLYDTGSERTPKPVITCAVRWPVI